VIEAKLNISISELCQSGNVSKQLIFEMVEFGIATPIECRSEEHWIFDNVSAHWLKKAIRLNRELEIDWVAVTMIIELLKQKESLQLENQQLQCQLQNFL
jgi:chaperone modulatory protein CbpM